MQFPEPTSDQKAYVDGWKDPVEARRRRIEALAAIVDGLHPWIYTPDLDDGALYYETLRKAKRSLLWELAWAGALEGAHVYDECGTFDGAISKLHGAEDWAPWIEVSDPGSSCELVEFVDMIECYVGRPNTKLYGEDAIVELARSWLERTLS
jgi:hypothetical protein